MSEIADKFAKLQSSRQRLRNSSAKERADKLNAIWAGVVERKDDIFVAGNKERGTHDLDIAAELVMIKGEIDFAVKNIAKWMKPEKIKNSLNTMGKRCEIRRQSKGVVLNLSAYNAPTAECLVPAIPAIAAGNAVAIKPSEHAPHSAQIVQEIINKALPSDEAEVFQGGVEVSQELLNLPFNHIYYTGGMAVGKIVMKAAADHFSSITLEMGGKSPVIVDETASLENAATKLAWGRVMNAGQVCIAPEYVIIHESKKDEFLSLIEEKINALYNSDGAGLDKSQYVPRIINERHASRIKALVDDATKKGATVVCGGGSDIADRYIEPTVLTDMSEDMEIMNEEVFGPVLSVLTYSSREEVLDIISRRPSPLALYVYSTNDEAVDYFLTNTSSGSAVVNSNCIQSGTNPRLPFGGVGSSGMGRIGGFEGFKSMSNERSVVHQPLDRFRDILIMLPPYSERYNNLIMKGLK
ncbi:MAG: aldehyde dehydrogenase family protein [Parasphingorhabdus sp.]|uniref:aldehyde dehydrogenase family protein n=3 Tax=Parasphingorhabdus sp. TaxID=2709688 RepID=UPI0032679A97